MSSERRPEQTERQLPASAESFGEERPPEIDKLAEAHETIQFKELALESDRKSKTRDAANSHAIIGIKVLSWAAAVVVLTRVAHLIVPADYQWLDTAAIAKNDELMVFVAGGAIGRFYESKITS